jgi:TRAP-type C4-dicarboxylate transport system substrate-binding protein
MMYAWGEAKGLQGIGFAPIGPTSIVTRKQASKLADLEGMKIRVLASPFQLELMRRLGASPIAMTLADVMPALQQGTIDGVMSTVTVHTTMHYYDVAKSLLQTEQPYVNSIGMMSKRWMASLPPDLQKVVRDAGVKATAEITPFVKEFFAEQEKVFVQHGGTIHNLSKSKPALNQAVKALFAAAARYK